MNAPCTGCGGLSRRSFLADLGLGFGGVALASMAPVQPSLEDVFLEVIEQREKVAG